MLLFQLRAIVIDESVRDPKPTHDVLPKEFFNALLRDGSNGDSLRQHGEVFSCNYYKLILIHCHEKRAYDVHPH